MGASFKFSYLKVLGLAFCFSILPRAFGIHSQIRPTDNDLVGQKEKTVQAAAKTDTSTKNDLEKEVKELGVRIADLFVCVPGTRDKLYSTQSWYLLNTFRAWNNSIAKSTYANDKVFDDKLKKLFMDSALEQLKEWQDGLEKEEALYAYIQSATNTTAILFKNALEKREVYSGDTDISNLVAKSHNSNEESVFKKLKKAHSVHGSELSKNKCDGLAKNFWGTPHISVPQSPVVKTKEVPRRAAAPEPKTARKTATTQERTTEEKSETRASPKKKPVASNTHDTSQPPAVPNASNSSNRAAYFAKINENFPRSNRISARLPDGGSGVGHTTPRANGALWGRPHIIGNILKAKYDLAQKGIRMSIGDINAKPTSRRMTYKFTPGHKSHTEGRAADIYLIRNDGIGDSDTTVYSKNYSREKTYEMLKAMIDADPQNVSRIIIRDTTLQSWLRYYLRKEHGYSNGRASSVVLAEKNTKKSRNLFCAHADHVHFHWVK